MGLQSPSQRGRGVPGQVIGDRKGLLADKLSLRWVSKSQILSLASMAAFPGHPDHASLPSVPHWPSLYLYYAQCGPVLPSLHMLFPTLRRPDICRADLSFSVVKSTDSGADPTADCLGLNESQLCDFWASALTSLGLIPSFGLLRGIDELVPERA